MKKKRLMILAAVVTGFFHVGALHGAEAVVLDDFDGGAAPLFKVTADNEAVDIDGDGDMEAKVSGKGFKAVFKYAVPRAQAGDFLAMNPVLTGFTTADVSENPGVFVSVLPFVQTDASGEDIYDPLKGLTHDPRTGDTFRFDLSGAETKGGVSLQKLLEAFAAGDGTFLFIGLVQQTSKNDPSVVYYDDLRFEGGE